MPHDFARDASLSDQRELLDELELRCRTDVSTARVLTSHRVKVGVSVRAANIVDRDPVVATGQTTELRRQGLVCLASRPVMVGSLFQLTFDRADLDLSPAVAVCDRCSMLGDSSFELCFRFVQEIDLQPGVTDKRSE